MDNWKQFHKLTFVHDSSMMLSVVLGTALGDPDVPLAYSFNYTPPLKSQKHVFPFSYLMKRMLLFISPRKK